MPSVLQRKYQGTERSVMSLSSSVDRHNIVNAKFIVLLSRLDVIV